MGAVRTSVRSRSAGAASAQVPADVRPAAQIGVRAGICLSVCLGVIASGCSADAGVMARGTERGSAAAAERAAVRVIAEGCSARPTLGSGSFVRAGVVVTVAHVVAGARRIQVVAADGTTHEAAVSAIDRRTDLAVLAVPTAGIEPLPLGQLDVGDTGTLVATRRNVAVTEPFTVVRFVDLKANDIDGIDTSLRQAYQIEADIEHGDSGAVLVVDGRATAVVWARSSITGNKAWATDIREAAPLLALAADRTATEVTDVTDPIGGPCPGEQ